MSDAIDRDQLADDVEGCLASQRSLVEHLRSLGEVDPATPSLLPGWSVAHVITHIARNADGVLRMLDGLPQYWRGMTSRNADIELGADRSWAELLDDVAETSDAVALKLSTVSDWSGIARSAVADRPKSVLPAIRRREVEVHRFDLGLGYRFADMPAGYIRSELRSVEMTWKSRRPMGLTEMPAEVLGLAEHDRLAWMFGRLEVPGVEPAGFF